MRENSVSFRHSSRGRPMKDSAKAFRCGFPVRCSAGDAAILGPALDRRAVVEYTRHWMPTDSNDRVEFASDTKAAHRGVSDKCQALACEVIDRRDLPMRREALIDRKAVYNTVRPHCSQSASRRLCKTQRSCDATGRIAAQRLRWHHRASTAHAIGTLPSADERKVPRQLTFRTRLSMRLLFPNSHKFHIATKNSARGSISTIAATAGRSRNHPASRDHQHPL
jgi:hypothetical protein